VPCQAELVTCDKTIERTNAWVLAYRRLAVRFDRQAASVLAFLHLACALICLRFLRRAEAA
jgi:transposase